MPRPFYPTEVHMLTGNQVFFIATLLLLATVAAALWPSRSERRRVNVLRRIGLAQSEFIEGRWERAMDRILEMPVPDVLDLKRPPSAWDTEDQLFYDLHRRIAITNIKERKLMTAPAGVTAQAQAASYERNVNLLAQRIGVSYRELEAAADNELKLSGVRSAPTTPVPPSVP